MIQWCIHITIISLVSWMVYKHFKAELNVVTYIAALLLKLGAGLILGYLFFTQYKSGDTISFFEQSMKIASFPIDQYVSLLFQSSNYEITTQPRVLFFIKFLSFFTLITNGSYWISSLYLSLISFICSCQMFITIVRIYPHLTKIATISFFFIPTIVFWSSGILKGTLAYGAVLLLISSILIVYHKKSISVLRFILTILPIFILWKVKHYLLISVILFMGLLFFFKLIKSKRIGFKWVAISVLGLALFSSQFIHPYLTIKQIPQILYHNNQNIHYKTDLEERVNINIEQPSWKSILKEVPNAIKTGLLRPSVFDKTPPTGWLHRAENMILTFLMIFSILLLCKQKPQFDLSLLLASSITIFILATLLALSTPNLGTLVRYKNPFMPFLFLITSILPYQYLTFKKGNNNC